MRSLLAFVLFLALAAPAAAVDMQLRPGTATAVAGAATLNQDAGTITTDSLTTAAGSTYTLTIGCDQVGTNSVVLASLRNGTNSAGDPTISTITPGEKAITIVITNRASSAALNGTLLVSLIVFK